MLPQSLDRSFGPNRRIKRRSDFLRIQQKGKKFRSSHFLLITASGESRRTSLRADSRIGITVTTKIDKRAARRNRLRRRVREVFRQERSTLVEPSDLVLIALRGATELSFDKILRQVRYLLYQSGLKNNRRSGKRAEKKGLKVKK